MNIAEIESSLKELVETLLTSLICERQSDLCNAMQLWVGTFLCPHGFYGAMDSAVPGYDRCCPRGHKRAHPTQLFRSIVFAALEKSAQ